MPSICHPSRALSCWLLCPNRRRTSRNSGETHAAECGCVNDWCWSVEGYTHNNTQYTITITRILKCEEMVWELLLAWPDTRIIWAASSVTHLSPKTTQIIFGIPKFVWSEHSPACTNKDIIQGSSSVCVCVCVCFPGEGRGTWQPFSPH